MIFEHVINKKTPFGAKTISRFIEYKLENRHKQEKFERELETHNFAGSSPKAGNVKWIANRFKSSTSFDLDSTPEATRGIRVFEKLKKQREMELFKKQQKYLDETSQNTEKFITFNNNTPNW